jgi:hypothetical protein
MAALGIGLLAGLIVWGQRLATSAPAPGAAQAGGAAPAATAPDPATAPRVDAPAAAPLADERVAAPAREAAPSPRLPQGLRGRVVDGNGRPLGGLPVHLVESAANDPLLVQLQGRQGEVFQPVASTATTADGAFALGIGVAQARTYDLYVTSAAHATARFGGIAIVADQWHDVGEVALHAGATVQGAVTVAGRPDIPVAGAVVTLALGSAFADAPLRALPDAGQGLVATTGADGRYELRHVPSRGVVVASAVAPGFARLRKDNLELRGDAPVVVDFALLPGQSIAGRVVDGRGEPLREAHVEAWPLEAGGEPTTATSAVDGSFEVLGLGLGKHGLRATRRGHAPAIAKAVDSGARNIELRLAELASVRVRVLAADGTPLRRFRLGLRRVFGDGGAIAAVPEVPDRSVRLGPDEAAAALDGVPNGEFCVQVEADGYAKALSTAFANPAEPGAAPRAFDVAVTMGPGATLRGRVVDEAGAPLADAAVRTLAAGLALDSPLRRLLADAVPERITSATTRTDADGWFTFERLALGDYQLVVEHDDACRGGLASVPLLAPGVRMLAPIVLPAGAIVAGRATIGGAAATQLRVVLATPADRATAADALRLETVTDPDGNYRMPRRVPPGIYELRAARAGGAAPEAHTVHMLLQLQRTAAPIAVASGQREARADIDLPSER